MRRLCKSLVHFLVFGVMGWWPVWRSLVVQQRSLAERGSISQRQYARTVGRMARQESLYSEVSVYFRMQGLAWGITVAVAIFQAYCQAGSVNELSGMTLRWLQLCLFVHA